MYGQTLIKKTFYYDSKWKKTDKSTASFYRVVNFDSQNKPQGQIKDYFISGKIQCIVERAFYIGVDDDNNSIFSGKATWFYESGKKSRESNFNSKGLYDGKSTFYSDNGIISRVVYYNNGNVIINVNPSKSHKSINNYLIATSGCKVFAENIEGFATWNGGCSNDYANGIGDRIIYNPDGTILSNYKGNMLIGKRNGQGKNIWPSNIGMYQFIGEFKDNLPYNGRYHYKDGNLYSTLLNRNETLSRIAILEKENRELKNNAIRSNSESSPVYSNSSPSITNNNAEMERRLNLQRPCKVEAGKVPDWEKPDEDIESRYIDFTVYQPKENGDYREIGCSIKQTHSRRGIFNNNINRIYYKVTSPDPSGEYDKFEDAMKRMLEMCKCENGYVNK